MIALKTYSLYLILKEKFKHCNNAKEFVWRTWRFTESKRNYCNAQQLDITNILLVYIITRKGK